MAAVVMPSPLTENQEMASPLTENQENGKALAEVSLYRNVMKSLIIIFKTNLQKQELKKVGSFRLSQICSWNLYAYIIKKKVDAEPACLIINYLDCSGYSFVKWL